MSRNTSRATSDRLSPPDWPAGAEGAAPRGWIVMYSTAWCGDCRRARRAFAASGVPYAEIDIEERPDGAELVRRLNNGMHSVPTILFPDGSVLVEPSGAALEAKLAALRTARG